MKAKIGIGDIVTLLADRTFPTLTDNGIQAFTMRAGLTVQVTGVCGTGVGIEIRKGAFATWANRAKVREATAQEAEDFLIATGDQRKPKKPRRMEGPSGTQNATAANVAATAGNPAQGALQEAA